MRMIVRLFWAALFVGVLVLGWKFAAANGAEVVVSWVFGEFAPVPVWLALLAAFAAGAIVAALVGFFQLARLGLVARRYRKTVRGLEAEVHQLRNLPLESGDAPLAAGVASEPFAALPRDARERGG
jgi:uncharacterized integral membrane protein